MQQKDYFILFLKTLFINNMCDLKNPNEICQHWRSTTVYVTFGGISRPNKRTRQKYRLGWNRERHRLRKRQRTDGQKDIVGVVNFTPFYICLEFCFIHKDHQQYWDQIENLLWYGIRFFLILMNNAFWLFYFYYLWWTIL